MGDESRVTQAIGRLKRKGRPESELLKRRLEQVYEIHTAEVEARICEFRDPFTFIERPDGQLRRLPRSGGHHARAGLRVWQKGYWCQVHSRSALLRIKGLVARGSAWLPEDRDCRKQSLCVCSMPSMPRVFAAR